MILILTKAIDPTVDFVCEKLIEKSIEFRRINLDNVRACGSLVIRPTNKFWEMSDGETFVRNEEISVVWQRRIPRVKRNGLQSEAEEYLEQEWRLAWEWWINSLDEQKILDPEWRLKTASNKFLQLKFAREAGFTVPETLATSDPVAFMEFFAKEKRVIAKTLGGFGRVDKPDESFKAIYTNRIADKDLSRVASIKHAPIIFQEEILKSYEVRVTLVGTQFFSCKIESQKSVRTLVDWRRYDFHNVPHSVIDLPHNVEQMLLGIARSLGINFASFDLAVTPSGDWVFFEMNPNSQWVWIENLTKLPITDALINLLVAKSTT